MIRKVVSVSFVVELPLLARGIPNEVLEGFARAYLAGRLPATFSLGVMGGDIHVTGESLYLGITEPGPRGVAS